MLSGEETPLSGEERGLFGEERKRKSQIRRLQRRQRKRKEKKEEQQSIRFEKGEFVDYKNLLFTAERDYLIKSNSDEPLRAHQLEGKVIVLFFVSLHPKNPPSKFQTADLVEIYNDLQCKGTPFEVVFVPAWDPIACTDQLAARKRFDDIFSLMPWTAIPFSDSECYGRLEKIYGTSIYGDIFHPRTAVVISHTGQVLQRGASLLFSRYGAAAYPFSDDAVRLLISKDVEAEEFPSVTTFLASPDRDYVINNKSEKIPVTDLKNKVVALYLYEECRRDNLTTALKNAYEMVPRTEFEVVLIYIHYSWNTRFSTNAESFKKTFATMPWLALPFNDANCRMVQRVCGYAVDLEGPLDLGASGPDPSLMIIGRGGEFCEPFGAEIVKNFGSLAFPFTLEKAAECRFEEVKKLKLDMLWYPETVFTTIGGSIEVRLSELKGKRIIVFFDDWLNRRHARFSSRLQERYLQDKGTSEEFEVIHLFYKKTVVADVPWLTHPPDKDSKARKCLLDVFPSGSGLLAFERDGTVVRVTEDPVFARDMVFPFSVFTMKDAACIDLAIRFQRM